MKITHLAQDEKVLPLARSLFEEAFPGANRYVVCQRPGRPPAFLKPDAQVRYRHALCFRLPWLMPELWDADIVVVHAMTKHHARALRGVRKSTLVFWIGYGFDYYALLARHIGGYWFPRTEALLAQINPRGGYESPSKMRIAKVAARIHAFSVNPSETAMLRAALPQLQATFHPLPSFTVEDTFAQGDADMDGPDVLLGQSASPHNNHLDAFELLRDSLPATSRLIVPLSYGNKRYADHVEQVGRDMFGDRFVPMRGWLPISDYQRQIAGCGFVVMNHRRQQAVGNISSALYRGVKVMLQRCNPLVGFFTELGAVVFLVDDLATDPALAWRPLTEAQRQANRSAMVQRYGRAQVVARIRALDGLRAQHQHPPQLPTQREV